MSEQRINVNSAVALWLPSRGRWFVEISKGRTLTAWSLAGASLFLISNVSQGTKLEKAKDELRKKGIKFQEREIAAFEVQGRAQA